MRRFRKIFVLLLLLSVPVCLVAQSGRDKVEAMRVAFISKKVELTPAEAEKFWPVYNEYGDKVKALRRNLRQKYRQAPENPSSEGAEELYELDVRSRQAEAEIHRQYSERIKSMIGTKKFVKLRMAEEQFRMQMLKAID
jgi:hypothetical protein